MDELISLNKYISSTGFCSRREADEYITKGRVTINNKQAKTGARVAQGDVVEIDGEPLKKSKKQATLYMAFNKPVGITSTTDTRDKTNIISYINYPKRIFPVGRLDKDSDGLILLTNDGDIVNKILRAGNFHEKEYIVTVDQPITPDFIKQMGNGVPILGTVTRKCTVKQEGNKRFRITLTQGMNRQIRRMCQHLDYKVVTLTRIRIMNIRLADLPVGKWRMLSAQEIDEMNRMIQTSSKTEEASTQPAKQRNTSRKTTGPATPKKQSATKSTTKKETTASNKPKTAADKPATRSGSYKEWRKR